MFDVCLLGTGGMMPLPNKWLSSLLLKYNGRMILIKASPLSILFLAYPILLSLRGKQNSMLNVRRNLEFP